MSKPTDVERAYAELTAAALEYERSMRVRSGTVPTATVAVARLEAAHARLKAAALDYARIHDKLAGQK